MNQIETRLLEGFAKGISDIPFNKLLGLRLDQLDSHSTTLHFTMKQELIGNFMHGILHGGVISSVLDMAGGLVVMAHIVHKYPEASVEELTKMISKCSTIDLSVNFISPGKGELFIAKASLLKSGNRISFTRMELFNQDETLIATGHGTYFA